MNTRGWIVIIRADGTHSSVPSDPDLLKHLKNIFPAGWSVLPVMEACPAYPTAYVLAVGSEKGKKNSIASDAFRQPIYSDAVIIKMDLNEHGEPVLTPVDYRFAKAAGNILRKYGSKCVYKRKGGWLNGWYI